MVTVSVLSSTLCLISGVTNGDICFLDRDRRETGAERVAKVNISKTKKDISKRKTPFFCILKGLSN